MAKAKIGETTTHMFEVYIKTTPEKLWQALTDGTMTEKYYYGSRAESDWRRGSGYKYLAADGDILLDGEVLESDPPRRLVTTFNPRWSPQDDYPESRVTFEITSIGDICKLSLVHEDLAPGNPLTEGIFRGWSEILSGLKTLLETGKPLVVNSVK